MRRTKTQRLNIWMNGVAVGLWESGRTGESLSYLNSWQQDQRGRPLSLSLPFVPGNIPHRGKIVSDYFDNLLPDNDAIRRRLAQRHQAEGIEAFQLLEKLGRDCVGAIQLLPEGEEPSDIFQISGDILDEAKVAERLRNASGTQMFSHQQDDLRLSIAGAQEKTALLYHQGQWLLPQGSTPTTHIFKLPIGLVGNMQADMHTSVENEWLCSKIVRAHGLPVAACEIGYFEDQKALVVERFDRRLAKDKQWIVRLPQEDMCQALGFSPLRKYQSDGGPGISEIMKVLSGSENSDLDRSNFFKTQIVFWLLAASDGHAKNFSIFHFPGSRYHATPLYDVLSAHPVIGKGLNQISPQKARMAMSVRGKSHHYLIEQIQRRHWVAQAKQVGLSSDFVEQVIESLIEQTESVISDVSKLLPANFPLHIAESIFQGMRAQVRKLNLTG